MATEQRRIVTYSDILDFVWPRSLNGKDRGDLNFHGRRWAVLLEHVDRLVRAAQSREDNVRILDIGPSLQTDMLRENYPGIPVDTLDLTSNGRAVRPDDVHIQYDLNDLYFRDRWPKIGPYDVVVMGEVIEHLYLGGEVVLRWVLNILRAGGALFLQTPNAAALHKRLQLLAGKSPYMPLDEDRMDPPHFHEFTAKELVGVAERVGLVVTNVEMHNYFTRGTAISEIYNRVCEMLPGSFRAGISLTLEKPSATEAGN